MQSVCPSAGEWQRFFGGEISDVDAGTLEAHLQACETCRALLPGLRVDDPIRQALRGKAPLLPTEKELVEGLIHRVKHLLQSSSPAQAHSDDLDRFSVSLTEGIESRLGAYRLVRLLGSGGMGRVFEAVDETLQRRVAVKIMAAKLEASVAARQRFLREARAVAALDHPNIVHIYQVGDDNGAPYFVMEFLEGQTLAERLLTTVRPTHQELAGIGRQIAEGLAAAHAQCLIHRDIKPANIFLVRGKVVKILDFGLVRHAEEDTQLTRVGDVLGTPAYMSPEQARGERIDHRADLFSLGCILYELCTGFTPFQAIHSTALLVPMLAAWPRSPRESNPNIPAALSALIVAMLATNPDLRPASTQQVVDALRAIEEGREAIPDAVAKAEPAKDRLLSRRTVAALLTLMLVAAILVWFLPALFLLTSNDRTISGAWAQSESLTDARAHAMGVELDGLIYLVGGTSPQRGRMHRDTLESLHPTTGVWRTLAPLPSTDEGHNGRSSGAVGVIDGKIYLAGGWRHKPALPTSTLLIYDPQSNSWEVGRPMPDRSADSVGGVIGRKFHVLSGTNGNDGLRKLFYVYDPDRISWNELKPPPRAHAYAAAGVIGGKLYVAGGNTDAGPTGGVDVYDPTVDTWTSLTPMPTPRYMAAAAVLNGQLVVLGGTNGTTLATVEAYDPATDRWIALPDLLEPRQAPTAAVVDAKLYLMGGTHGESKLTSIDIFTLFHKSR